MTPLGAGCWPGRVVLVTGASGGLGQAIARALAARGARLLLTGRRAQELQALASELGASSRTCDLGSRAAVAELAEAALEAGVEVLVANAGLPAGGRLTQLSQDEVDLMLEVNLRAPIALARALAPSLVARRSGHLVFVSSLQGKAATPLASVYCATKFGLRGFALGARADLAPHGVGVSTIFPGFIREAGMFAASGARLPPLVGTRAPEDVAAAVIRAVEHDRAELDVAPPALRLGAAAAGLMPQLAGTVTRRLGAERVAEGIVERQRRRL